MAKIVRIKDTLVEAHEVQTVWEKIPDFKIGPISINDFMAARDAAESMDKDYSTKDVELTGVRVNRDEKARQLSELITRFRSGIRSAYGPDSVMYQEAGGTRSSLRRSRTRSSQAAPSTQNGATAPA